MAEAAKATDGALFFFLDFPDDDALEGAVDRFEESTSDGGRSEEDTTGSAAAAAGGGADATGAVTAPAAGAGTETLGGSALYVAAPAAAGAPGAGVAVGGAG